MKSKFQSSLKPKGLKADGKELKKCKELDAILKQTPIGIWKEHIESSKCNWSANAYEIFSLEKGLVEPSLSSILRYVDQADRPILDELIKGIKNQSINSYPHIILKYKGLGAKPKILLVKGEPIYDRKGKSKFWQGTIQDITSLTEFEEGQKDWIDDFSGLINSIPSLVFATDSTGSISFCNKACEDLTGFKNSELVGGREPFKIFFPGTEQRRSLLLQLKEGPLRVIKLEQLLITKKGDERYISWQIARNPFSKEEGQRFVFVGTDITKRKLAKIIEDRNNKRLEILSTSALSFLNLPSEESVFNHLGVLLEKYVKKCFYVVCSSNTTEQLFTIEGVYGFTKASWQQTMDIIGWNPLSRRFQYTQEVFKYLGKDSLQLIDKNIYDFTDGTISSVASRALERQFSIENIYTMGFYHYSNVYGGLVVLTQGDESELDISLIQGIVKQATLAMDRKKKEGQLLLAKKSAEESDKLKSNFLANLSHEIRTPMNAILGFSQLLYIPNLKKEKKKEYIDIINAKGKMLVKLINDIIDITRVETGQLTVVNSSFKLNNLMQNIKTFYDKEKLFQQREAIDIVLNIPPRSGELELVSDEGRLEQVLTNLMSNALKFTEKGYVEFGYEVLKGYVEFYVKDTGIGIDPSKKDVIFDRYKQLDESVSRSQAGTGLGLSISKGIVELLGGKIWVESVLDQGASFKFTIPHNPSRKSKQTENVELQEESKSYPDWKNKVLLIAEDEEINYVLLTELLEPTGVKIIWANDGAQAVELVSTIKKIDAVLMDIRMPVMNGYAATLEIRQLNSNIPIIAQTAFALTEDRAKAEAAGCDGYITKPINSKELFEILDKYLG